MGRLVTLALRSLAARRLRSVLTVVGIGLGVGVLSASLAVDRGIERSIDRTVTEILGRADFRVSAFGDGGLSEDSLITIRSVLGVEVAAPAIEERTYLVREIDAVGAAPGPVTLLGIDPILDPQVHDLELVAGAPLSRRDEAAAIISERLAADDGYGLGSEVAIQAGGEPERFRVIGITAGDGPLVGVSGRTVVLPIDAVTRIFGDEGAQRVDLLIEDGIPVDGVEAELVEALTTEPFVLTSPRDLADSLRASTGDFRGTSAMLAGVALFVGAFLVFNAVSMTVGERIREIGLLRAAGATRRQITGFVLAGAATLGLIGSALGLFAGTILGDAMSAWVGSIGSIQVDRVDVGLDGVAVTIALGLLVTVAAALEPAWRAGRISPVEALRIRAEPARARRAQLRWLLAVFAAVAGVGLLVWPRGSGDAGILRPLAVYAILLVAAVVSATALVPLGRLAGAPFAALFRFEERLARSALSRDPSRTALTVGALTVGLAMIVAIGGVAGNARRAAGAWLESVVPGDMIVTSIRPVALDEAAVGALRAVSGVERVSPIATFDVAFLGRRLDAAAVDGGDLLSDGRLTIVSGDRAVALGALDAGGAVVLPRTLADRLRLGVGDAMPFALGAGRTVELRVAGIAERTLPGRAGETILVGWPDATLFGVKGADFFAVRFLPGRAGPARPGLESLARQYALEPSTLGRVEEAVADALGRVFVLFDGLALVAVVVAALGIVNTLTMNVLERVREIGVLRAVGMTRRQVRRMVVIEAGVLGLAGAVLGSVTGLAAAAAMILFAGGRLDPAVDVPWTALALCVGLGVGLSMAAAWYPARLAGRLSIVRAVRFG